MIKVASKKNKKKRETKHSSLAIRWVSIVILTITVSFLIFSVAIYHTVGQEAMQQQRQTSHTVVRLFQRRLAGINQELEMSNVIPSLSPSTRRILDGMPVTPGKNKSNFNDALVSVISNPNINVAVYNLHHEVIFSNGNQAPRLVASKENDKTKIISRGHNKKMINYAQIRSDAKGKLTGYVVVVNKMTGYNSLMNSLLSKMILISVLVIVAFSLISYLVVASFVKPIKEMSRVAQEVNDDPNSTVRVKKLRRNDELGELVNSLNQMLDRMQSYIDQQKQFVSDVSHELRTPVAVIEGHLSMLERWGKNDPKILNESIKASLQEANRMKQLIQEMLDLTRAEQVNVQYPNAVTQVDNLLHRVVSDMSLVHPDFRIQLEDGDLPTETKIQIYQGHLEQLLVILIDNAVKYSTDRKEVIVSAGVSKDQLEIVVQDFGEGIAPSEKKKIFHRFYRVDKARSREKGGNGLGLAIAAKLTQSYSGKISVESVEGQGSQFKLQFPVLTPTQAAILEEKESNERR